MNFNKLMSMEKFLLLAVYSNREILFSNAKDEVYLRIDDENKKLTYKQIVSLQYDKGIRSYEGNNVWKLLFSKGLAN